MQAKTTNYGLVVVYIDRAQGSTGGVFTQNHRVTYIRYNFLFWEGSLILPARRAFRDAAKNAASSSASLPRHSAPARSDSQWRLRTRLASYDDSTRAHVCVTVHVVCSVVCATLGTLTFADIATIHANNGSPYTED